MKPKILQETPKALGYSFPPEWAKQEAMWLSWPHKAASWPEKMHLIFKPYCEFIKAVSHGQKVRINVCNEAMKHNAIKALGKAGTPLENIEFYIIETDDAWCRDHGPAFVTNGQQKAIVDWGYNAWGGKYPPFDKDDKVPTEIAKYLNIPLFLPGIVMEGGSVEFNGEGVVLTTTACLLNKNRNPHLTKDDIEHYLKAFYGQNDVLWIDEGIVGDDTDGHIDDIVRFVDASTVLACAEKNPLDENYEILQNNLQQLKQLKIPGYKSLNIIELPMPSPVIYQGQRLPASYANFYIANEVVVVPTFGDANDRNALEIIQSCFPTRKAVGINSVDIIWGLGSFHCLSQQEPSVL